MEIANRLYGNTKLCVYVKKSNVYAIYFEIYYNFNATQCEDPP